MPGSNVNAHFFVFPNSVLVTASCTEAFLFNVCCWIDTLRSKTFSSESITLVVTAAASSILTSSTPASTSNGRPINFNNLSESSSIFSLHTASSARSVDNTRSKIRCSLAVTPETPALCNSLLTCSCISTNTDRKVKVGAKLPNSCCSRTSNCEKTGSLLSNTVLWGWAPFATSMLSLAPSTASLLSSSLVSP